MSCKARNDWKMLSIKINFHGPACKDGMAPMMRWLAPARWSTAELVEAVSLEDTPRNAGVRQKLPEAGSFELMTTNN